MPNFEPKLVYYYVICVIAFFVFLWGVVDLAGSSIGIASVRTNTSFSVPQNDEVNPAPDKGDQYIEAYYQKRMFLDRFWDSLVRVIVSGVVFGYSRYKVKQLEEKA